MDEFDIWFNETHGTQPEPFEVSDDQTLTDECEYDIMDDEPDDM